MLKHILLFLSPWVLAASASAAVTCDTLSSTTTEADPQTLSYTVGTTSTTNRVVVVQTDWREEGGTIAGVTFDGVSMTQIGTSSINTTPNPDVGTAAWIITGVSSGTYTISANWSSVLTTSTVKAFTCYDVDQTTPVRVGSPDGTTATNATSVSIAISSAVGDLVVDSVADASSDPSVGAGQSLIGACVANNGTNFDSCASSEAGAASVTMSYTTGVNAQWAITAFSLQPPAAAATTRNRGAIWLP